MYYFTNISFASNTVGILHYRELYHMNSSSHLKCKLSWDLSQLPVRLHGAGHVQAGKRMARFRPHTELPFDYEVSVLFNIPFCDPLRRKIGFSFCV